MMKAILTEEEFTTLVEYGTWMEALYKKKITPLNEQQKYFLVQLESNTLPEDKFAQLFWKYLKRKEIAQKTKLNNVKIKVKDDREDWKKIRNMRF